MTPGVSGQTTDVKLELFSKKQRGQTMKLEFASWKVGKTPERRKQPKRAGAQWLVFAVFVLPPRDSRDMRDWYTSILLLN